MSDGTIGNALYPGGPKEAPQGVAAGHAGTPAAPSPAPRETGEMPLSPLARAFYPSGQPASTPQGSTSGSIEAGRADAAPASAGWRGVGWDQLPAGAHPDST